MIACRTRHDLSSASSTMAGSRLSDRSSMPITGSNEHGYAQQTETHRLTGIDLIKFADDVQPDFRELVLQQVKEERQKMLDGGVFSEQRGKAADLVGQGSADVLRGILTEVPHARDNPIQNGLLLQELGETYRFIRKLPYWK